MAIRYDTELTKNIQRVVRNFNQKVDRLERINDKLGIYDLPEKVSIKALKKSVSSRKELYRKLEDLSLFSQRNIEQSMQTASGSMSRYDYELLKKEGPNIPRGRRPDPVLRIDDFASSLEDKASLTHWFHHPLLLPLQLRQ